jgi:hypothetical protein
MDTLTNIVIWTFGIVNAGEMLSHFPQIFIALSCRDGARSISMATWSYFAFAYLTGALYFLSVAHDGALATLFFGNCLACLTLLCVVLVKRRRFDRGARHSPDAITSQVVSIQISRRLMPAVRADRPVGTGRCGGLQSSRGSRQRRSELPLTAYTARITAGQCD